MDYFLVGLCGYFAGKAIEWAFEKIGSEPDPVKRSETQFERPVIRKAYPKPTGKLKPKVLDDQAAYDLERKGHL